jgi:cytidylate kinase
MVKIIVIRGPLGVGKTTVSKILAHNFQAEYISVDAILDDNNLAPKDGIPLENFLKANEIISDRVKKSEKSFVVDGNFYYQEQINDLKNKFKDTILFFTLTSTLEKCIERDSKREKIYGEDSTRYVYMMTARIKEGVEIDTTDLSIEETVQKIAGKIE